MTWMLSASSWRRCVKRRGGSASTAGTYQRSRADQSASAWLLLNAAATGVRPFFLQLPRAGRQGHAALEAPGALVGDLVARRVVPGVQTRIGDGLHQLVRGDVGERA